MVRRSEAVRVLSRQAGSVFVQKASLWSRWHGGDLVRVGLQSELGGQAWGFQSQKENGARE